MCRGFHPTACPSPPLALLHARVRATIYRGGPSGGPEARDARSPSLGGLSSDSRLAACPGPMQLISVACPCVTTPQHRGRARTGAEQAFTQSAIRLSQSDRAIALWTPSLLSRGQRAGSAPSRGGQRRACQTRRPWEKRLIQPRPAQILARSIYVRYSNACRRA